ncbi:MAG: dihydropyrimidinase [Candidatus Bipolaricaulota bacterium]
MQAELAIRGGTVVTPWAAFTSDVAIEGGRIAAVGDHQRGRREIDATGMLVLPGAIDAHTHMAAPVAGQRSSDDFLSGSRAAASGGVTTIIDFTAGSPERSIPEAIEARERDAAPCIVDYALHGEVVGWTPGRESEFGDAVELGVASFKFYTTYESSGLRTPPDIMAPAFRELAFLGAIALVHAEDEGLLRSMAARLNEADRGRMATLAEARPDLAEAAAISQVGRLARDAGCRLHIVHVSSAAGLSAVRAARAAGGRLTAETCPQYLLLTRDVYDLPDGHLFAVMPPLRRAEDRRTLWSGLARRDLDFVATDHCPFTRAQKAWRGAFDLVAYGLPGVETLLPLLFSEGVAKGRLALPDVVRLLAEGPARTYGLYPAKGSLEVGADADVVLFDPAAAWTIRASDLHMETDFSPYEGFGVTGRVVRTLSRGEEIFRDGEIVASAGRGHRVHTKPLEVL